LAFLLAGCATTASVRPPLPPAAPAAAVDCDADETEVKPGRIPDGFVPVIAYRCDQILTIATLGAEGPPPAPAPPYAYEGDLSPLVAALTQPDDPTWDGACALMMIIAADIWLEDPAGTVIRAGHPVDGCGQPKVDVVNDALNELTLVTP
jgi:hypothetical protein